MSTQHFFLNSATEGVPDRCRQAFQAGQAHDVEALLSRLREQSPAQCMVWLSSDDTQSSEYLVRILQTEPAGQPSHALVAERLLLALTGTSAAGETARTH